MSRRQPVQQTMLNNLQCTGNTSRCVVSKSNNCQQQQQSYRYSHLNLNLKAVRREHYSQHPASTFSFSIEFIFIKNIFYIQHIHTCTHMCTFYILCSPLNLLYISMFLFNTSSHLPKICLNIFLSNTKHLVACVDTTSHLRRSF